MIPSGYAKIHRDIFDHWLWKKKPFSQAQAWIDMILLANHKEQKVVYKNQITEIGRGEFIRSRRDLAKRWGWTDSTVQRFIVLLEKDSMIVRKSNQKANHISICNYNKWQNTGTNSEPIMNHERTNSEPVANLNKNVKNEEEDHIGVCPQKEILELWTEILPELPKPLIWSDTRKSLLKARWNESKSRQSIEWWEKFFTFIKESKFLMGNIDPTNGRKRFQAKLDWVLKQNNFIKILEGNYHGE